MLSLGRGLVVRTAAQPLAAAAHERGLAAAGPVDPAQVRALDLAVLLGIRDLLARAGEDLVVAERHRWIPGHWARALAGEGWADAGPPRRRELAAARDTITNATAVLGYPPALATYLLDSLRALPALLRDEVSAQSLLFASGVTDAVYRDNPINRYLNAAAASVVATLGERLRVLELGAGTGATTADLLAALPDADYLFTDLSPLFLRDAAARFTHPGLRFRVVDFAQPLDAQLDERAFDLVVAVNTAHNAPDVQLLLCRIKGVLRPGGHLLLIETHHEHHQSLASMPFLLSPRDGEQQQPKTDARAGTTRTYLTTAEWRQAATAAGLRRVVDLPPPHHPLAAFSQRLAVFTTTTGSAQQ